MSVMLLGSFLLGLRGNVRTRCRDFPDAGLQTPSPEFIVDVESMDIFPVGWCEANSYPLTTPHKTICEYRPGGSQRGRGPGLGR